MSALSDRLRAIEEIVGLSNLLTATDAVSQHRFEGQQPLAVAFPRTPVEVAAVLRQASDFGLSVLLRGAGRHMHIGAVPGPVGLIVSLSRLDEILDFDHENLTITAQAGVTLAAMQRKVAERGQMLPLDPPGGDEATIGGIAATNLSGPLRMRHGTPRDLVIGLRVALTDGTIVKTGGKTVKNVAGYELTKLFVGSYGTLAAVCEVTVRLTPKPEAMAVVMAGLSPERGAEVARYIMGSRLEVASVSICNRAALDRMQLPLRANIAEDAIILFAGLIGDRISVARQQGELRGMLGVNCTLVPDELTPKAWQAIREIPYPHSSDKVVLRVGVPISQAAGLMQAAASWDDWWTLARIGDGIMYAGTTALIDIGERLRELRARAEAVGGYAVLEAGGPEVKRSFGVWGAVANLDLMRKVKDTYDPRGILGCGRYLAGL